MIPWARRAFCHLLYNVSQFICRNMKDWRACPDSVVGFFFHSVPGTACVLPGCLYIRLRVCIVPVNRLWQWLCSLAPGNILCRGRNRSRSPRFPLSDAVCPGSDSVWYRSLRIWCRWWIFFAFLVVVVQCCGWFCGFVSCVHDCLLRVWYLFQYCLVFIILHGSGWIQERVYSPSQSIQQLNNHYLFSPFYYLSLSSLNSLIILSNVSSDIKPYILFTYSFLNNNIFRSDNLQVRITLHRCFLWIFLSWLSRKFHPDKYLFIIRIYLQSKFQRQD